MHPALGSSTASRNKKKLSLNYIHGKIFPPPPRPERQVCWEISNTRLLALGLRRLTHEQGAHLLLLPGTVASWQSGFQWGMFDGGVARPRSRIPISSLEDNSTVACCDSRARGVTLLAVHRREQLQGRASPRKSHGEKGFPCFVVWF